MSGKRTTVTVTLELTEPQRIAFEHMMFVWNQLAGMGSSRWTAYYADGDGDFKPDVKIDGKKPEPTKLVDGNNFWGSENVHLLHDGFFIDYDTIAWRLLEKENTI